MEDISSLSTRLATSPWDDSGVTNFSTSESKNSIRFSHGKIDSRWMTACKINVTLVKLGEMKKKKLK